MSQMDATAGFIHAKRMQQKAKKALEALGISHISPNSMVYDLSAADQKMVEIAKVSQCSQGCFFWMSQPHL
ncbi:MAG: hypothetical protein ACLS3C_06940 [Oscillospiraceae bacterium]